MHPDLKRCALEYLKDVDTAYRLILEGMKFPIPKNPTTWISLFPSQKGKFEKDGINRFFLHGFGCDFKNQSINVRWDFGMRGEWNGISPWMFSDYIEDNNKLTPEFHDRNRVISELQKAVLIGVMEKIGDHFYFLESSSERNLFHLNL